MSKQDLVGKDTSSPLGIVSDGDFLDDEPLSDGFFLDTGSGLDWVQFYLLDAPEGLDMDLIALDSFGELSEQILLPVEPIVSDGVLHHEVLTDGGFLDE